jgi:hypothetical protein
MKELTVRPISESMLDAIDQVSDYMNLTESQSFDLVQPGKDPKRELMKKARGENEASNAKTVRAIRKYSIMGSNNGGNFLPNTESPYPNQKNRGKFNNKGPVRGSRLPEEYIDDFMNKLIESNLFTERELLYILESEWEDRVDAYDDVASKPEVGHKVIRHNGRRFISGTVTNVTDKGIDVDYGKHGKKFHEEGDYESINKANHAGYDEDNPKKKHPAAGHHWGVFD